MHLPWWVKSIDITCWIKSMLEIAVIDVYRLSSLSIYRIQLPVMVHGDQPPPGELSMDFRWPWIPGVAPEIRDPPMLWVVIGHIQNVNVMTIALYYRLYMVCSLYIIIWYLVVLFTPHSQILCAFVRETNPVPKGCSFFDVFAFFARFAHSMFKTGGLPEL